MFTGESYKHEDKNRDKINKRPSRDYETNVRYVKNFEEKNQENEKWAIKYEPNPQYSPGPRYVDIQVKDYKKQRATTYRINLHADFQYVKTDIDEIEKLIQPF
jgi:hypothetical protein